MTPIRYHYFRDSQYVLTKKGFPIFQFKQKGGVTVAYTISQGRIKLAVAKCRSNECFVKKIGREMAHERLSQFSEPAYCYEAKRASALSVRQQLVAILADQFFLDVA